MIEKITAKCKTPLELELVDKINEIIEAINPVIEFVQSKSIEEMLELIKMVNKHEFELTFQEYTSAIGDMYPKELQKDILDNVRKIFNKKELFVFDEQGRIGLTDAAREWIKDKQ